MTHTETTRFAALHRFIAQHAVAYQLEATSLAPASADASFRRYFRIEGSNEGGVASFIIMDAPPAHEDCAPFVAVSSLLSGAGLAVPCVLAQDLIEGFLLLTDLGSTTYLQALQGGADHRPLYDDALTALVRLQSGAPATALPAYSADKLIQEMALFDTWFLGKHHGITLTEREQGLLGIALKMIACACTAQAQVWVHRDYHCRNLMVQHAHTNPGVLDFQDAVTGPYTYDLASLLRDAYIDWPEVAQIELALAYWKKAQAAGLPVPEDFGQLWRDFEWMGLQRHLKVLGIFARLHYRDGKDGYLKDLPVVLAYAQRVAQRYDGLGILVRLFDRAAGVERRVGTTF